MDLGEIETWLGDVRQEKENGHTSTEHTTDAIIELLEQALREHKALQRVFGLRDELAHDESPMGAEARSFAAEIDRTLKGQR
jgi:hypothetical protein